MGVAGPVAKHGGRRQRGRTSNQSRLSAELVAAAPTVASLAQLRPDPDPAWLAETAQAWVEYLGAPEAGVTTITDLAALRRLFGYRDSWLRTARQLAELPDVDEIDASDVDEDGVPFGTILRRGVVTAGSTGQPVLHPLTKLLGGLEAQMRPLEDRFGLNPLYRLRLGITVLEAEESLEARNKRLAAAHGTPPGALAKAPAVRKKPAAAKKKPAVKKKPAAKRTQ